MEQEINFNQGELEKLSFSELQILWKALIDYYPMLALQVDKEISRRIRLIFPDYTNTITQCH